MVHKQHACDFGLHRKSNGASIPAYAWSCTHKAWFPRVERSSKIRRRDDRENKAWFPRVERSSKIRRRDDRENLAFTDVSKNPTQVLNRFYYSRSYSTRTGRNTQGKFRSVVYHERSIRGSLVGYQEGWSHVSSCAYTHTYLTHWLLGRMPIHLRVLDDQVARARWSSCAC